MYTYYAYIMLMKNHGLEQRKASAAPGAPNFGLWQRLSLAFECRLVAAGSPDRVSKFKTAKLTDGTQEKMWDANVSGRWQVENQRLYFCSSCSFCQLLTMGLSASCLPLSDWIFGHAVPKYLSLFGWGLAFHASMQTFVIPTSLLSARSVPEQNAGHSSKSQFWESDDSDDEW